MKIGYAQSVISPSLEQSVYLAGFGQNRRAESVHDDLYARALAISDGSTTLVLCALDLIGFFQNDVREVLRRLHETHSEARIVLASTHTHHGPDTMGLWGPDDKTSGVDPVYLAEVKDKIVATIERALQLELQAAAVKTGGVHVPGVVKNARDPEIVDNELTVLQFLNAAGEPLVTLMDFPCHPEVLWEYNPILTSDYPHFLRQEVEAQSGAACLFFSGALGGMLTPDVKNHSFDEALTMGMKVARAGLKVLEEARAVPCDTQFRVGFSKQRFMARLQNPLFKIAIRRGLLPEPRDRRGRITTEVNLLQIGDCWLVTVPGELLPKLGLAIKHKLSAAGAPVTGIIGLANDELGYILPKEDYRYPLNPLNPKDHYEETMSISKEFGPRLMEAVDDLLLDIDLSAELKS